MGSPSDQSQRVLSKTFRPNSNHFYRLQWIDLFDFICICMSQCRVTSFVWSDDQTLIEKCLKKKHIQVTCNKVKRSFDIRHSIPNDHVIKIISICVYLIKWAFGTTTHSTIHNHFIPFIIIMDTNMENHLISAIAVLLLSVCVCVPSFYSIEENKWFSKKCIQNAYGQPDFECLQKTLNSFLDSRL